jgi:hypothetical protein
MPDFMARIIQLLTVANYGPNLSQLLQHNILGANMPVEILQIIMGAQGASEWQRLRELDEIVRADEIANSSSSGSSSSSAISADVILRERDPDEQQLINDTLNVFSTRIMDMTTLNGVVNLSQSLGMDPASGRNRSNQRKTPKEAKRQLIFHGTVLAPHLVEILFVLCTLLSGRRKVEVQDMLSRMGFGRVLLTMFERLSWDAPPFAGVNPLEHVHGPGCDCNPESAFRVQFLRLLHNYYDRDFQGNPIKFELLTPTEVEVLTQTLSGSSPSSSAVRYPPLGIAEGAGIMGRVMAVMQREPTDSLYRFWLSSCLEAFLRGTGPRDQVYVARGGVLEYTTKMVIEAGQRSANNILQTAFDFLGELVKANRYSLQMLADCFDEKSFGQFAEVVLSNLVDSNVFIRSLYMSEKSLLALLDSYVADTDESTGGVSSLYSSYGPHGYLFLSHEDNHPDSVDGLSARNLAQAEALGAVTAPGLTLSASEDRTGNEASVGDSSAGYLSHTWIQFSPALLITPRTSRLRSGKARAGASKGKGKEPPAARNRIVVHHSSNDGKSNSSTEPAASNTTHRSPLSVIIENLQTMTSNLLNRTSRLNEMLGSDSDDDDASDDASGPHNRNNDRRSHNANEDEEDSDDANDDMPFTLEELGAALGIDGLDPETIMAIANGTAVSNNASSSSSSENSTTNQNSNYSAAVPSSASDVGSQIMTPSASSNQRTPIGRKSPAIQGSSTQLPLSAAASRQNIARILDFLLNERVKIVLKLLSSISIRTINHENICCLNTAILLCLLSYGW